VARATRPHGGHAGHQRTWPTLAAKAAAIGAGRADRPRARAAAIAAAIAAAAGRNTASTAGRIWRAAAALRRRWGAERVAPSSPLSGMTMGTHPDANIHAQKAPTCVGAIQRESTPRGEEEECGMGASVAHGEGAHLLAVNEKVAAVLSVRCDAARAPHCTAQAVCRVA